MECGSIKKISSLLHALNIQKKWNQETEIMSAKAQSCNTIRHGNYIQKKKTINACSCQNSYSILQSFVSQTLNKTIMLSYTDDEISIFLAKY